MGGLQPAGDTSRGAFGTSIGREAMRFVVVGASAYVLNLTLYSLGLAAGLDYLSAATVAYCLGFAFNFLANRLWTFRAGGGDVGAQFVRFSCVAAVMVGLDLLLLRLAIGEFGAPKIAAQAIIILFLAPLSFLGNRMWAFGTRPLAEHSGPLQSRPPES
jgi:putative flippase GtrA